ncbi:hypothetical protein SCACP_38950 [Sporomusa carbonis]
MPVSLKTAGSGSPPNTASRPLPHTIPAYLLRLTGKDLVKANWEVYYDLKAAVKKCRELVPDYNLK